MAEAKKTSGAAKTKATKAKEEPKVQEEQEQPTNDTANEAKEESQTADQESLKQEEAGEPQSIAEEPEEPTVSGDLPYLDPYGGIRGRHVAQKAVLYTDGLSGPATQNLERAYEINERLQSNDPEVRESGDESLSPSAEEAKSDKEKRIAERVKGGHVGE